MWLEPADTTAIPSQPSSRPSSVPRRNPSGGGEKLTYDEYGVAHTWGTINMNAVDANGDISSVTTTSGIAWKVAGRVGDSPIIGAGQYCDNTVGAAGSTGRGESNIKVCGAFLAVEFMRQGMTPEQAIIKVMERVIAMTEKRLLNERGRPYFDLQFYALAKDGRFAAATAYEGSQFAVCDAQGPRHVDCAYLFKASERPRR
jgi:N4-(beta-N-acetylglucosaminyl)-L-asparaginase